MARLPNRRPAQIIALRFCPLLMLATAVHGQGQDQLSQILSRLDRLERENRALAEEVRTLRARLDGAAPREAERTAVSEASDTGQTASQATQPNLASEHGENVAPAVPGAVAQATAQTAALGARQAAVPDARAAAPADLETPPPVPVGKQLEILQRRVEEMAESKVEASQRFPIRITGQALVNAYANSRQSGGSQYPAVASATPGPATDGGTLRQSIVGLDFRGPVTVWGGQVHGSLYVDFFSGTTNNTVRFRTGSVEISWKNRSLMAGVEKPIFNPREPASLAQVGISPLTGAGNLWLWLPQVRFEQDLAFGAESGLRAQAGVLQTRESGPYPGSVFSGAVEATRPALEGRFEFFHRFDTDRRVEVAPGFHVSQSHAGGFSVPSRIFSLDWFVNPWRRVELSGAFYRGENVAPLGAGYNQGFGIYNGYAEAVESTGGWAQLTLHLLPRLDLHLFTGQQDDRNGDLLANRIGKNLEFGANLFVRLAPNVILGPEISQVRTVYLGQGVRINNHYDLALAYLF